MIAFMRWGFIAGLIVAGLALVYLSALTMKTKLAWAKKVRANEQQLAQLNGEIETLRFGEPGNRQRPFSPEDPQLNPVTVDDSGKIGLRLVNDGVMWWTRQRGRTWTGFSTKTDPATGGMTLTIEEPRPHQIGDKAFLYIFESRSKSEGGKYLGEFRVTAVTQDDMNNSIEVVPTDPLSADELDAVVKGAVPGSGGNPGSPLQIYDKLPADRYATFLASDTDAINALLPDSVKKEYLKHGTPAEASDPPERVDANKNYQRPLYDFMALFRDMRARRPIIEDKLLARTNDLAGIQAALKLLVDPPPPAEATSGRVVDRAKEIAKLEEDLKKAQAEQATIAAEQTKIEQEVAAIRQDVDTLLNKNKEMAAELTKNQRESMSRVTSATAGSR